MKTAVSDEISQTPGYALSLYRRKLIEQGFGWVKTVGLMRPVKVRGLAMTGMTRDVLKNRGLK